MTKTIHTPEHVALRQQLIAARKTANLTQEQVASSLGRPQSFVAKYEGGERRLDVIEFIDIAIALGRDPVELFQQVLMSQDQDAG